MGRSMKSLMDMGSAIGHRMLGMFSRAPSEENGGKAGRKASVAENDDV